MCSFSMAQIKKPMLLMGIDIDKDMWEITDSTYSDDRQERIMILSKKELT
jgi:alpha-D-ribose 1-methylphosphonate 5-triphosphate synthase subunit PhnL